MDIHLRALSDGGFHSAAQFPKISYYQEDVDTRKTPLVLISGSRLVLVMDSKDDVMWMVIWDWKSAQIIFVCQPLDL